MTSGFSPTNPKGNKHNRTYYQHSEVMRRRSNRFSSAFSMMDGDVKSNDNNMNEFVSPSFQDSTGSLYADCVGDCGNSLAKLIAAVVEKNQNSIPFEEKVSIISKYFAFYDSRMRKYLVQLMQKSRCMKGTKNEQELLVALKNVKMYDDRWTLKFMFVLEDFMDERYPSKVKILQKLAQKSCRRPMIDVYEEVKENVTQTRLQSRNYYYGIIEQIQKHPNHQKMVDLGKELSYNEMLAVFLYTELDSVSSAFRRSHREQCISCKWRQTFTNFGTAIKKLHRVFVCDKDVKKEFFHKFKAELYHGIPIVINQNENQPLKFRTITSLSVKYDISMRCAWDDDVYGSLLCLKNICEALSNSELIAAPVDWISPHDEQEWCLLPTDFLKWTYVGESIHGVKIYSVFEYESKSYILGDDIDECFLPAKVYLGNIPSIEKLNVLKCVKGIGILFGVFSQFRCEHCQIKSRLIDFRGNIWEGMSNCPCCRKYVFGGIQDEYQKVLCYNCGIKSRKFKWKFPFKNQMKNFYGVQCPHCFASHKISLRNFKMQSILYRADLRNDFKEYLLKLSSALFDTPITESEMDTTLDKLIPKLYDQTNLQTDFTQIAFNSENPKVKDFLSVILETPFGRKLHNILLI